MNNDLKHLQGLLEIYRNNLRFLEERAATYGGESQAPLSVRNQLDAQRKEIAEIEAQHKALLNQIEALKEKSAEIEALPKQRVYQSGEDQTRDPAPKAKYYLFISETKVNDIYNQVFYNIPEPNIYGRLQAVVKHIYANHRVGNPDDTIGNYFAGTIDARYFTWAAEATAPSVIFSGKTEHTLVMLAGAAKHLTGAEARSYSVRSGAPIRETQPEEATGSALGPLHDFLQSYYDVTDAVANIPVIILDPFLRPYLHPLSVLERQIGSSERENQGGPLKKLLRRITNQKVLRIVTDQAVFAGAEKLYETMQETLPAQKIEFLARRLQQGSSSSGQVVLGSPYYVALADD